MEGAGTTGLQGMVGKLPLVGKMPEGVLPHAVLRLPNIVEAVKD